MKFLLTLAICQVLAVVSQAVTFDLADDWSDVSNPNGPWSYNEGLNPLPRVANWRAGEFPSGQPAWATTADGRGHIPSWFKSTGAKHDFLLGDVIVHSQDNFNGAGLGPANVTWTSSIDGTISIAGGVWLARNIGRSNDWTLSLNGTVLASGSLFDGDIYNRSSPSTFLFNDLPTAIGDIVKLEVIRTSASGEFTGVNLTIDAQMGTELSAAVSAASFEGGMIAPGQIVSLFGAGLADAAAEPASLPLPVSLGGTEVWVIDRLGVQHSGQFFFVSPDQINMFVPSETALGDAMVRVRRSQAPDATLDVRVAGVAPGVFTANATGGGVVAGFSLSVLADGARLTVPLFNLDAATKSFVPAPIDLGGEDDQVFLLLFGTGIRGASNLPTVLIGGEVTNVLFAGPHEEFVGLDQINVGPIPRQLARRGEVNLLLFADGIQANPVVVSIR